jgi:hypothetical protein
MSMNFSFLRFNVAVEPTAGAPAVTPTPPAPSPTLGGVPVDNSQQVKPPAAGGVGELNLDAKVTVEGKQYTVAQLLEAQKQGEASKAQVAKLQKTVKAAFVKAEPKTIEDWKSLRESTYEGYIEAGWTPQEAAEQLKEVDARIAKQERGGDEDEEEERKPAGPTPSERHYLNRHLETNVDRVFKEQPEFTKIATAVEANIGKDKAKVFLDNARTDLLREIGARVKVVMHKNGASYVQDPKWIDEVLPEAVKATAERYSTFAQMVDSLGKSRSAEADPFSYLDAAKPKERPVFKHGEQSRASFETQMEEWTNDAMARALRPKLTV